MHSGSLESEFRSFIEIEISQADLMVNFRGMFVICAMQSHSIEEGDEVIKEHLKYSIIIIRK